MASDTHFVNETNKTIDRLKALPSDEVEPPADAG